MKTRGRVICLCVGVALLSGCGAGSSAPVLPPAKPLSQEEADANFREAAKFISFLDDVPAQPLPSTDLKSLPLQDREGRAVTLGDVAPGKHLVVVMTRGFNGAICPYCSSQTARLISKYREIADLNAEVVLIYPLEAGADAARAGEFLSKVNSVNSKPADEPPPFPVLLDIGLKVVDTLGIRKELSKPATYILDPTGSVRFAYVGNTLNDRPSVKAIVQQLQQLQAAGKAG